MPTPELKRRAPGKQSIAKRTRANILNSDLIRPFGPVGTTAGAHGLVDPEKPLGPDPRRNEWNDNDLVVGERDGLGDKDQTQP